MFDSVGGIAEYIRAAPESVLPGVFEISRRLTYLSFKVFDFGIPAQRLVNMGMHFLNAVLVFQILKKMVSDRAALVAAIFFAVNPAAIYTVAYVIERSQLLVFGFGALVFLTYWKALDSLEWKWGLFYFCVSLFFLKMAVISKEHALLLVAIYPLLSLARRDCKRWWVYSLPLVIGALVFVATSPAVAVIAPSAESYREVIRAACEGINSLAYRSVLTQAGLFFKYFLYWLVPFPTSIDMRAEFVTTSQIAGVLFFWIYGFGSLALLLRKTTRYLGLGLLLAAALFVTEFSRVRLGEIFVMYRSYLFSMGYVIAFGWCVERLRGRWMGAAGLALAVLAVVTMERVQMFRSEIDVWKTAIELVDLNNPKIACQSGRIFSNAGGQLVKDGKFDEAINYMEAATVLAPKWDSLRSNLGIAYLMGGKMDKAKSTFSYLTNSKDEFIRNQSQFLLQHLEVQ